MCARATRWNKEKKMASLPMQAYPRAQKRKEESDMPDSKKAWMTYCSSSASLRDSCLVQITFRLVKVLGGLFRALFVSL